MLRLKYPRQTPPRKSTANSYPKTTTDNLGDKEGVIMSDTILAAVISGALGIGGTILGVFIGGRMNGKTSEAAISASNKNAINIMRMEAFNFAAAKLRAAFAPAQVKLSLPRELGNVEARKYFGETFLVHAAAIEEFRPFVSDSVSYQKACDEYRNALFSDDALGDAKLRWDSGMMINEHGDNTLDFLNVIDERIKAILNHA